MYVDIRLEICIYYYVLYTVRIVSIQYIRTLIFMSERFLLVQHNMMRRLFALDPNKIHESFMARLTDTTEGS